VAIVGGDVQQCMLVRFVADVELVGMLVQQCCQLLDVTSARRVEELAVDG